MPLELSIGDQIIQTKARMTDEIDSEITEPFFSNQTWRVVVFLG